MVKGAIFDMDGVLLDSMPAWGQAGALYLESLGKTAREGLTEVLFTKSWPETARYLQEEYQVGYTEQEIIDGINKIMYEQYRSVIPAKKGATEFLAYLKEKGIRIAVATASDRELAMVAFRRLGLTAYMETLCTCLEVGAGKESPKVYDTACKALGLCREEVCVFEDALHAVRTAAKAGYAVVGVYDEASRADWAEIQKEARACVTSLSDLLT